MKKILLLFVCTLIGVTGGPAFCVTINKAAPVAEQSSGSSTSATTLVPTVLNLISSVQQLSAKQRELTDECIPSSQEITFVNNIVKEWAKTGAMTADEVQRRLGQKRCSVAVGGYESSVESAAATDMDSLICYDFFGGDGNSGMVWENFPMAAKATYCSDGSPAGMCSDKNKVTVSNIYDIFNLVDFTDADYSASELTMASKLISKIESCSYSKLNAKKRQLWGEFLTGTINSLGQSTNTGSIMESVGTITGGAGFGTSVGSIGALATSLLSK